MKKVITAVAVVLISAALMLLQQLIFHTHFQFTGVDWQSVVVNSLIVDASVYVAFAVGSKNKDKSEEDK